MVATQCPFCNLDPKRILLSSPNTLAFFDNFPITEGHTLIIPKRHVRSLFELPDSELAELWSQVAKVRTLLSDKYQPDGFNIGVNDGAAAGQTITHAHIHVIPRRKAEQAAPATTTPAATTPA